MRRSQVALIIVAWVMAMLTGCGSDQPPFTFVGENLPNFTSETTSTTQVIANGVQYDTVRLPQSNVSTAEKYVEHLKEKGWQVQNSAQDVDTMRVTLTKDERTMEVNFRSDLGVTLNGSQRKAPAR